MTHPLVRHRFDSGVAEITLDRPEAGNAMNLALLDALNEAVEVVTADPRTRAILLTGTGRNFCVGGDIKEFSEDETGSVSLNQLVDRLHHAVMRLADHSAPVVVAAQGASAGAGLSLVAGADLAIAGRSATFTLGYPGIGLTADGGATWFLPRVVGLRRTQELAFTGRRLTAVEAERFGLVVGVLDDDALINEAQAMSQRIAAGPTQAFGAIKRLLAGQCGSTLHAQLEAEHCEIVSARRCRDAQEGVSAFLTRRQPHFMGK